MKKDVKLFLDYKKIPKKILVSKIPSQINHKKKTSTKKKKGRSSTTHDRNSIII